jgi:hypothetical protein
LISKGRESIQLKTLFLFTRMGDVNAGRRPVVPCMEMPYSNDGRYGGRRTPLAAFNSQGTG